MSVKIMKNSVSLKDETTQTFLPIGMFAAGGDKSLTEFKEFADTTVNEANTQVQRAHDNVGQLTESITSALETGTDTTLSLPGVAADAKATGDKIGELKEDLIQSESQLSESIVENLNPISQQITKNITVTGNTFIDFKFEQGKLYSVGNHTNNMSAFWLYNADTSIQELTGGMPSGGILEFVPIGNATRLRSYNNGIGVINIKCLDTFVEKTLPNIVNDIDSLESIIIEGNNKFNKYETKDGYFLEYNSGREIDNSSFCYSTCYSKVKPNTVYTVSSIGYHICFYDKDKRYCGGSTNSLTFTTTSDTEYIRVSCSIADKNTCMVYEGISPISYEPFSYKLKYQSDFSKHYVVVDKNGNGDYTSVTMASANEPSGTIIYVMPGIYDNEKITGTYTKKQYIIGTSAQDCIIKNHTGKYLQEPIQIGAGLLKNLTFIAEEGTDVTSTDFNYAVHVESHLLHNENLTIENCILISHNGVAFGMGMRGGCHVILKNTTFISTRTSGLLFHDSNYDDYLGEQNISIMDCLIYAKNNNNSAIVIQSQEKEGSIINLEMTRNRLKSTSGNNYSIVNYYHGIGGDDDFLGCINLRLLETSWGNSDSVFNAD